jgi:DNA-directed RNA polymerase specialized sigma24 family protein
VTAGDLPFEVFVAERSSPLLRTAYLLTGGHQAAGDLLQTALVGCHRHWDPTRTGEQATAVVRRELVAAHVGWRNRMRVGDLIADSPLLAGTRGLPGFGRPAPDAGPRDELGSALAQLPPRLRAALVLRYGEGLPDTATADALGIGRQDVPVQAGLALTRLRALLGGSPPEDGAGEDGALVDRLRRELPARAADVVADPAGTTALARDGVRARRRHRAGLAAVVAFVVLVVLLVALTG